jgi:hypothetical protein
MQRSRRPVRSIAATLVAGSLMFGAVACGSDGDDAMSSGSSTTAAGATTDDMGGDMGGDMGSGTPATATPAADLRATLTAGLQEHVYLAGIAVFAAVNTPDQFDPAAEALDENSVALSEAITSVYGDEAGEAFLGLWRSHIGMFVDYTNAKAKGDDAGAKKATDELTAYATDFGEFLEGANPNLPADAVAEELKVHAASLITAIDATVAGDPGAFSALREAAGHMPMTAATLAGGISTQFPEKFGA